MNASRLAVRGQRRDTTLPNRLKLILRKAGKPYASSGTPTKDGFRRNYVVAERLEKGLLTETAAAAHSLRPGLLFMPHFSNSFPWSRRSPLEWKAVVRFPPLVARVVPTADLGGDTIRGVIQDMFWDDGCRRTVVRRHATGRL